MKLLLLVVALGLAEALPLEDNSVCQPHSRPWHVSLHGGASCSGALIDKWWIVTSFLCVAGSNGPTIASLGDHDVAVEEGTEQHIRVDFVMPHSPYRSPLHSLALVRLASPAHFNEYVQPIPLASHCTLPGEICQVSGWGSTNKPTQQLKCITVPVMDDQTCMNRLPNFIGWGPGMVCTDQANTDNCNDQGSVMVCNGQLQGVQWFANGCYDPAYPIVYTKLCRYNEWINDVRASYTPTVVPTTVSVEDMRQQRDI
uniref:Peptidase S1 domain-containing protein n=1 Tax=Mola mola TaxID=94237 RepID=A0A3Q3WAH9_MOLML